MCLIECHLVCLAIREWNSWSIEPRKRLSFFFVTKPWVGVFRVMAEIQNQNLQAQMGMLTTTPTCWEPRNTFEVLASSFLTFRVER